MLDVTYISMIQKTTDRNKKDMQRHLAPVRQMSRRELRSELIS